MKHKTHKATAKRFKVTGSGKLTHKTQGDNTHLKVNKNYHQKARKNSSEALGNKSETKKLKQLMNL
jgi:ribosomal protein L35